MSEQKYTIPSQFAESLKMENTKKNVRKKYWSDEENTKDEKNSQITLEKTQKGRKNDEEKMRRENSHAAKKVKKSMHRFPHVENVKTKSSPLKILKYHP